MSESLTEMKGAVEALNKTYKEFTDSVNERLGQVEKKGAADPITTEKVNKLNDAVGNFQGVVDDFNAKLKAETERNDKLETMLKRRGNTEVDEKKEASLKAFNSLTVAHAAEFQRQSYGEQSFEQYGAYLKAQATYLRKGDRMMTDAEIKAMSVGSDPDGGYWVDPDTSGRIVKKVFETSPVRQVASVQTISKDALEGFLDLNEGTAVWVTETGTRGTTNTPQIGKWRIPVHEFYAQPATTQQMLDDSAVSVEQWLADKTSDKFSRTENAAFVNGDGNGKPRGFTSYTTGTGSTGWGTLQHVPTGTNASYGTSDTGAQKLVTLVHSLKTAYRQGAVFAMNRNTVGQTRLLKDAQGAFIWLPSMQVGQPSTLLAYPVVEMEDMSDIGTGNLSVAFGNFGDGYQIVDRQGIRVLRDPYTSKPYVLFYTTKRVGGDVLNFEAIKFLKFS